MTDTEEKRVLSIDPISRGFGFAVLEGPKTLIDWGVKQIRHEKSKRAMIESRKLMEQYSPDVLVLEDWTGEGFRRSLRSRKLIESIRRLAQRCHISIRYLSRFEVREVFAHWNAMSKHEIALIVALEFPELRGRVPRRRKIGDPEDERMAIFDAVAFVLTYFHCRHQT